MVLKCVYYFTVYVSRMGWEKIILNFFHGFMEIEKTHNIASVT